MTHAIIIARIFSFKYLRFKLDIFQNQNIWLNDYEKHHQHYFCKYIFYTLVQYLIFILILETSNTILLPISNDKN